jgi:hypothetical protein
MFCWKRNFFVGALAENNDLFNGILTEYSVATAKAENCHFVGRTLAANGSVFERLWPKTGRGLWLKTRNLLKELWPTNRILLKKPWPTNRILLNRLWLNTVFYSKGSG